MGINDMCKKERAWVRCHGKYLAASTVVPNAPTSPDHAPDGVLYQVTLNDFVQVRL
jgi:hypothetical protein